MGHLYSSDFFMSSTMLCAAIATTKIKTPKTIPVIINFLPKRLKEKTPVSYLRPDQILLRNMFQAVSGPVSTLFKCLCEDSSIIAECDNLSALYLYWSKGALLSCGIFGLILTNAIAHHSANDHPSNGGSVTS
jgi:hypothetical protein